MTPSATRARAATYDLLGVQISILDLRSAVDKILAAVTEGDRGYVCVTGMHGIMEARDDASLQGILNAALLCTPDGMPTVWLGNLRGHQMDRVYGPDLMLAVFKATRDLPIKHFFYGGAEGVADLLRTEMQHQFPGIQVVGTYCPPFRSLTETEKRDLTNQVEASQAHILWVGLSTPKQERFMAEFLPRLPVNVMLGVGAAFDFHTGRVRQAPRWMMGAGLEWFFRLVTEPRRLWRRYLIQVPRFATLVGLDAFGLVSRSSVRPELPRAFLSGRIGFTVLPLLAVLTVGATLIGGWRFGGWAALQIGLLGASMFASCLVSLLLLMAGSAEEHLDRAGPIVSLVLFLWSSVVAGVALLAGTLATVFGRHDLVLAIFGWGAGMATLPVAVVLIAVLLLMTVAVCKMDRQEPPPRTQP